MALGQFVTTTRRSLGLGAAGFDQLLGLMDREAALYHLVQQCKVGIDIEIAYRFAKERGALVLAMTDAAASPIAEVADICLLARSDMVSFVDSLVAPLSLINALIVEVSKRKPGVSNIFTELEEVWNKYDVYEKNPN